MRIRRTNGPITRPDLAPPELEQEVAAIVAQVREGGDEAVALLTRRFDGPELPADGLRVGEQEIGAALAGLDPSVQEGLLTAIGNVLAVAQAQLREPTVVDLSQGQRIEVTETPVRRAAVYVPGGRAAYPSTVVMGAVTARAAGVDEVVVCSPPGPDGQAHPTILAACALCEVREVYRMGGAQAIAALAYGTESVAPVEVIVGPGNAYVQEAKRQVAFTAVGIDGIAGPSELAIVAEGDGVDPTAIALDLLAQAEHGSEILVWLLAPDEALREAILAEVERLLPERPSVTDAELQVGTAGGQEALAQVEAVAPEHLQLVGSEAVKLAGSVRSAGCVFVGGGAATAFGDYVAGSNHVLPTGGAARFQGALSVSAFRRRMARVSLPGGAAARLAPGGAALARAEGFPVHAESMERRA